MDKDPLTLSVREVAAYLMCTKETVRRLVRRGALAATRVGGRLRFRREDIDAYLRGGDIGQSATADGALVSTAPLPARGAITRRQGRSWTPDDHSAAEQLWLLAEASALLTSAQPLQELAVQLARLVTPRFADGCTIHLADSAGRYQLAAVAHLDTQRAERARSHDAAIDPLQRDTPGLISAIDRGAPALLTAVTPARLTELVGTAGLRAMFEELAPRTLLVLPLRARQRALGVLCWIVSHPTQTFAAGARRIAEALAQQLSLAVDGAQLAREADEARRQADGSAARALEIIQVAGALAGLTTIDDLGAAIVQSALAAFGADAGAVYVLEQDGRSLRAIAAAGYPADDARFVATTVDRAGPLRDAIVERAVIAISSGDELAGRWPHLAEAQRATGDQATITAPLLLADRVLGAVHLAWRRAETLSAQERTFIATLAHQYAQALDHVRLSAEAQAAVRVRDEFLHMAAHELRTPLTVVLGQMQLLQRRLTRSQQLTERDTRAFDAALHQAQRLQRLVHRMLDSAHSLAIRPAIQKGRINLTDLVLQVIGDHQMAVGAQHTLTVRVESQPVWVAGEALWLEQVLHQLLDNAVHYSPSGGPIEVQLDAAAEHARISVRDHGIGIPETEQRAIFERFYRASNATASELSGLGVGLFYARTIIALHDGAISVSSAAGQGSTFTVTLPLEALSAREHAADRA